MTAPRIPEWRRNGEALVRDMVMRDFDAAWDVVRHIAEGVEVDAVITDLGRTAGGLRGS